MPSHFPTQGRLSRGHCQKAKMTDKKISSKPVVLGQTPVSDKDPNRFDTAPSTVKPKV